MIFVNPATTTAAAVELHHFLGLYPIYAHTYLELLTKFTVVPIPCREESLNKTCAAASACAAE